MTDNIGRDVAVRMVMHGVLRNEEELTPEELVELVAPLRAFNLQKLGGILMGIRLSIRWYGFAAKPRMGHVKLNKDREGTLLITLSIMEDGLVEYVLFALRESGFEEVKCLRGSSRTGWRVQFIAPPDILARFGTIIR